MTYGDFKDLVRRITSDKVLCVNAFNNAENPKYHGYQHGLALIVYRVFDKTLMPLLLTLGYKLILKANS